METRPVPTDGFDGQLVPTSVVIDVLLDARSASADPTCVDAIDRLLRSAGSRRLMTASEARETVIGLERIEQAAAPQPVRRHRWAR